MARNFNGTSEGIKCSLNLSAYNKITIGFWLWWNVYSGGDNLAMEFTANQNSNAGGWYIDPNNSSPAGYFGIKNGGTSGVNAIYTRPSAATWHHYLLGIDSSVSSGQVQFLWIDGAVSSPLAGSTGSANPGNFANSQLNLMCRNQASLFAAGRMAELGIWPGVILTTNEAAALAGGKLPREIRPTVLQSGLYLPIWGLQSPEPDLSGNGNNGVLTGTSQANHAPVTLFTRKARTPPDVYVSPSSGQLFRPSPFDGIGAGGGFFANPLN